VLRLGHCRMGYLPSALRHLLALEELSLESNKVAYLPPALWRLERLRAVNASSNAIEWLSPGVASAKALTSLDLSHNALLTIPAEYASKIVASASLRIRCEGNSRLESLHAGLGAQGRHAPACRADQAEEEEATGLVYLSSALRKAELHVSLGPESDQAGPSVGEGGGEASIGLIGWREKLAFKLLEQASCWSPCLRACLHCCDPLVESRVPGQKQCEG
jgi:Leucine-rich repeat (LRR) protein